MDARNENFMSHFTDEELARRWKCSKVTIWRLRKVGKLRSGKIAGGRNLTHVDEVERIERETGIARAGA